MTGTRRIQIAAGSQQQLAKQPGELARLRVFHGPDSGAVFVLTKLSATIGRGEENDIVLGDLKASRKHAELKGVSGPGGVSWSVRDCGSANGILHNGKPTREASLRIGDTVSMGETTLELADPAAAAKGETQFALERVALAKQIERVRSIAGGGSTSSLGGDKKRPLILLAGGVAIGFFLMMGSPEEKTPQQSSAGAKSEPEGVLSRDLASFLPPGAGDQSGSTAALREAESFFRSGFREYRERNLLRARSQFETALQVNPNHRLAALYLRNVEARIQEEVKASMENGARKIEAGKLRDARTYYSTVMRLLYREPSHPDFAAAREKIEMIDRETSKSREGAGT